MVTGVQKSRAAFVFCANTSWTKSHAKLTRLGVDFKWGNRQVFFSPKELSLFCSIHNKSVGLVFPLYVRICTYL